MILLLLACADGIAIDDPGATDVSDTPTPVDTADLRCTAYEFRGEVYDCRGLDRCRTDAAYLPVRLACCTCDAELCEPDRDCPPPTLPPPG